MHTQWTARRLAADAMFAAMVTVLGLVSISTGNLKITVEALPVFLGALLLGPVDGLAIGGVGTLLYQLLRYGVSAMIGKGERGETVREAVMETGAVYFAAIGGCAAYMAACVEALEVVAYEDLGTESIKRLVVRDLPLTVALDARGGDAYAMGTARYRELFPNP